MEGSPINDLGYIFIEKLGKKKQKEKNHPV